MAWRVLAEEVALHHHAEQKEHDEAAQHLAPGLRLGGFAAQVTGQREGHGHAAHEEKEGHDEVPGAEALPHLVVETPQEVGGPGGVQTLEQPP